MSRTQTHSSVVLIGAGRVGTAVALLLRAAGYHIAAVGFSNHASTSRAAKLLDTSVCDRDSLPVADIVLIGVPDAAISEVAGDIASRLATGSLIVHFAGAIGLQALQSVTGSGAYPAALHPVQACPDVDIAVRRLPGSAWGVTCRPEARAVVEQMVRAMGGNPVLVDDDDRVVWHAAAATVANGTSAVLAAGEAMLRAIDVSEPVKVLGPLASGTVANSMELSSSIAGLTGPVARADLATIRAHIDALTRRVPEAVDGYKHAVHLIVAAAEKGRRLTPEAHRDLLAAIERL